MYLAFSAGSPSIYATDQQPCARPFHCEARPDCKRQNLYPSPPMSRSSSAEHDITRGQNFFALPTTTAMTTSTLSHAHPTREQSSGFIPQFHQYPVPNEHFAEALQRPHSQPYPPFTPNLGYPTSHVLPPNPSRYIIPPTTAIAPIRPTRKSKQHVQSACMNCKQAHLSCDDQRPCLRCERRGIESTCIDVPHRKRGRPRIREQIPNEAAPFPLDRRRQSTTTWPTDLSTGGSGDTRPLTREATTKSATDRPPNSRASAHGLGFNNAVAFLDVDLRIVQVDNAFREMFNFLGDVKGLLLESLIDSAADEESTTALDRIRTIQLHERDEKNPAYLPPIRNAEDPGKGDIPPVGSQDLKVICQGYHTTRQTLQFRSKESKPVALYAEFCMARTAVIFVILKLPLPQSPRKTAVSQGASSIASTPPHHNYLEHRRQSNVSLSRLSDVYRASASEQSSPTKSSTSFHPPPSPVSPASRQSYQQHQPSIPPSTVAGQAANAFHSFPYHPTTTPTTITTFAQPPQRPLHPGIEHNFPPLGSERAQHSAPFSLPTSSAASTNPLAVSAEDLRLPPITSLASSSSFSTLPTADRGRQESSHEQQAQQRATDRARRDMELGKLVSQGSQSQEEQPLGPETHGNGEGRETRKRKRGLDVSELTG